MSANSVQVLANSSFLQRNMLDKNVRVPDQVVCSEDEGERIWLTAPRSLTNKTPTSCFS
jgi:hypothetical protein